jgi:hypothetical protein
MNKKIFYGMIALLSVSLFFLGCDTGTSNDSNTVNPIWPGTGGPNPPPNNEQGAASLASVLGQGAVANGSTVFFPAGATPTIARATEIPLGVTLSVPAGVTLTVSDGDPLTNEDGDFLTNNGILDVAGTLTINSGTLTNVGILNVTAPLTVPRNIDNRGTITVGGTGAFTVTGGGIANSASGNISVATTGAFTVTGPITNNGTLTLAATTNTLGAVTAFTNGAGAVLNVNSAVTTLPAAVTPFTNDGTIIVGGAAAGTFTVPAGLTNNGTISVLTADPVPVPPILAGTLVVTGAIVNNGTLNLAGTNTLTAVTAFTNGAGAVLNVNSAVTTLPAGAGLVTNDGTITVGGAAAGTFTVPAGLANTGTISVLAAALGPPVVALGTLNVTGAITNDGTLNLAGTHVLTGVTAFTNNATLNVNSVAAIPTGFTTSSTSSIAVGNGGALTVVAAGLPNNGTISISNGGTLAVTAGGLTNGGTISISDGGGLTVNAGALTNTGPITIAGTLAVPSGANSDTITVTSDGSFTATTTAMTFTGTGKIVVASGGTVADATFTVGDSGSTSIIELGTGAGFSYGSGYTVTGPVTVADNYTIPAAGLPFTVQGILTIDAGKTLTLADTAVTGASGAQIIINTGGGIALGTSTSNYYTNVPAVIATPIGVGTYSWLADVGGSFGAGWKLP